VIKMTRRPEIPGITQSTRNDQFAGFLLGTVKGVLVAAFVTAGIQKYALNQITTIAWAGEQVKSSWALKWNEQFQPAAKIWSSPPVQNLVKHVQRMGLQDPSETPPTQAIGDGKEHPPIQTTEASRPSGWEVAEVPDSPDDASSPAVPLPSTTGPKSRILDPELDKAVEEVKAKFAASAKTSN
jgi:hypothetical protein